MIRNRKYWWIRTHHLFLSPLRLRQYQGGRRRRWPPRGLGLCALSTARNPKIRELQPHRGGQSAQHLQPQLRASDAEAYKLHHQQRQQQPPLLSSKPQGSQRSQKQSLQTPFPISAATEPTQQQQQPCKQPPQRQKRTLPTEIRPQAVTEKQQCAEGMTRRKARLEQNRKGRGAAFDPT